LPAAVRHADSLHSFKRRLKSHFFSLCFNDWQCNALQVRLRAWRALNSLYLLTYLSANCHFSLSYCWVLTKKHCTKAIYARIRAIFTKQLAVQQLY